MYRHWHGEASIGFENLVSKYFPNVEFDKDCLSMLRLDAQWVSYPLHLRQLGYAEKDSNLLLPLFETMKMIDNRPESVWDAMVRDCNAEVAKIARLARHRSAEVILGKLGLSSGLDQLVHHLHGWR